MTQAPGTAVVAMSGGVDSSVAAAMLKQRGWRLIGITMRIWPCDDLNDGAGAEGRCCSLQAVADAQRVARLLGIPHSVLDVRDIFQREVIEPFCADYAAGRTPNPCIRCNRYVKFGALAQRAREVGASHVATGHYARIERDENCDRWIIRTGVDGSKDQSYALYSLGQEQLAMALLPLGELRKAEVRRRARELGLPAADRPESQELCFIVNGDYPAFVRRLLPGAAGRGPIVDSAGRHLGTHRGIACYTIGQRRGLGLSGRREALYVADIDPRTNTVVVGHERELYRKQVTVGAANYVGCVNPDRPLRLHGKLRYKMAPQSCVVHAEDEILRAEFDTPQRAVTPGQAAVFYDGDVLVCGGIIEREARAAPGAGLA